MSVVFVNGISPAQIHSLLTEYNDSLEVLL